MTVSDHIKKIKQELSSLYDANEINSFVYIIFEHLLNYSKIDLILNKDQKTSLETDMYVAEIIYRLRNEEPMQYVIGKTLFCDLEFKVTKNVLIPRPETEELTLMVIKEVQKRNPLTCEILDIGTGSGCIAVSIKKFLAESKVTAIDVCEKAIEIAKSNALANSVEVDFRKCDILNPGKVFSENEKFDAIVSNPPYVTSEDKKLMKKNVLHFEPSKALFFEGNDPLVFYRAIAAFSKLHLKKDGFLFLEINEKYGKETGEMLEAVLGVKASVLKDLSGKDRFAVVKI